MFSMMLTDDEFRLFSNLIYHESGIAIRDGKRDFLQARLQKRLQANQLNSFYRYYKFVTDKTQGQRELLDLVDSLTINETSFFRNKPQFELFADHVIPELVMKKKPDRRLRFWSAGCSKGQEAYSIAMSVRERVESPDTWDIRILASDISLRVLDSAQKGIYNEQEVEAVHPAYQREYFDRIEGFYHVKPCIKKLVVFDFHNLKHENGLTGLDAIFCRNVMIYFDRDEQMRLVEKFYRSLDEGGFLFLGHAETLQGISERFKFIYQNKGSVYQKQEQR